jgi:ZIP family zinc transporter
LQPVLSLLAPAIEMTGREGFAKVMPASFGFPWCLVYFGIDKVLPHLHINFKVSGIKSPCNELPFGFGNYTIRKDWLLEFFWWSGSWYSEASIAGNYIAIRIGFKFSEGIAVAMPLRRMGMSRSKSFMYGQGSALVEPVAAVLGAFAVTFSPNLPYALAFAQVP